MMMFFLFAMSEERGQEWTLDEVYERYRKLAMKKAMRILKHREDAEDAVGDAWVTIARNLPYIRNRDARVLSAYIIKTVQMKAMTILQKNLQRQGCENEPFSLEEHDFPASDDLVMELCEKETVETIMRAFSDLKTPYKDVLTLYYLQELPPSAIADTLEISERTVWTRIYRGREKLIELLRKEGIGYEK